MHLKIKPEALPLSARDLVEFTPPGLEGQADAPVYLIRVPTFRWRARWEAWMDRNGAAIFPSEERLRAELRAAIRRVVADDQVAEALAIVDRLEEAGEDPDLLSAAAEEVTEVERQILTADPLYARLLEQRSYALALLPVAVAKHLLAGWRGIEEPFEAEGDGVVTDACLARLPRGHVEMIGWKGLALLALPRDQEKNSKSPSRSRSARNGSRAEPMLSTAAAGSSSASDTTSTPALS